MSSSESDPESLESDSETEVCVVTLQDSVGKEEFFRVVSDKDGDVLLNLRGATLSDIPDEVLRLTQVTKLFLDTSKMTTIPDKLQRMANIKSLDARNFFVGDGLFEFPIVVAELRSLKVLNLCSNYNMTSIPLGICSRLHGLEVFIIVFCKVKFLPSDFGEMKELCYLDVRSNPVENLVVSVSGLSKLQHVGLDAERLKEFVEQTSPNVLRNVRSLRTDRNLIHLPPILPRQLAYLPSLNALYLQHLSPQNYLPLLRPHLLRAASCDRDLVVPPDLVMFHGRHSVEAYYRSLEDTSATRQKRIKAIVNGRSMAGKTSLVNAIEHVIQQRKREREKDQEQGSCLTQLNDRTVSVEQRDLRVGGVDVRMMDTGGHRVYELTNQVVTTNNSLVFTVIDSSQYDMTAEHFYEHVGRYLHVMFDMLLYAYIVLVMSKIDECKRGTVHSFAEHILRHLEEFLQERKSASDNLAIGGKQRIKVHSNVMLTSAKSLEGIKELVQ